MEIALRALGLFNETTVISPRCGAGMVESLMGDDNEPREEEEEAEVDALFTHWRTTLCRPACSDGGSGTLAAQDMNMVDA